MSDDLDGYQCDPGYCQLVDLTKQAQKNLARAKAAEAALAAITAEENRLCADLKQAKDRADADRARLAKAVEALREAKSQMLWCARDRMESKSLQQFPEKWAAQIDATLAEIGARDA